MKRILLILLAFIGLEVNLNAAQANKIEKARVCFIFDNESDFKYFQKSIERAGFELNEYVQTLNRKIYAFFYLNLDSKNKIEKKIEKILNDMQIPIAYSPEVDVRDPLDDPEKLDSVHDQLMEKD